MNVGISQKPALLRGISARLVADGVISTEQAQTAIRESSKKKIPLINYLSQTLDIDSYELAELAAAEFGVPLLDLSAVDQQHVPRQTCVTRAHDQAPNHTDFSTR